MLVFVFLKGILNLISVLFLLILFLVITFVIVMSFSTLKIQVKYIKKNFNIIVFLYLFNKIRYCKLRIDKEKTIKVIQIFKKKVKKLNLYKIEKNFSKYKKIVANILKRLDINLEYIRLDLKIGTEFMLLTSIIIITLSSVFPLIINKFIKKYDIKNYVYQFTPIYNKNEINLKLNCIISVKMVHIISVIFSILLRKGEFKNDRTSNTRFNDNCYE